MRAMNKIRSRSYPVIPLETAVEVLAKASRVGKTWTRDQFANYGAKSNASSAKSGAYVRRLAALKEYGLIESDKDAINLTALGEKIVKSLNDEEHLAGLREAFLSCGVFQALVGDLKESLANRFSANDVAVAAVNKYGITRDAQTKLVKNFLASAIYAQLMEQLPDNEYRLTQASAAVPASPVQVEEEVDEPQQIRAQSIPQYVPAAERFQGVTHQVAAEGYQWSVAAKIQVPNSLSKERRNQVNAIVASLYDLIADLEGEQ